MEIWSSTAIFIVRVSMVVIFMPEPSPVFETIIKTAVSAYPDKFLSQLPHFAWPQSVITPLEVGALSTTVLVN